MVRRLTPRLRASSSSGREAARLAADCAPPGITPRHSVPSRAVSVSSLAWMASRPTSRSPPSTRVAERSVAYSATARATAALETASSCWRRARSSSWRRSSSSSPRSGLTGQSAPGRSREARSRVRSARRSRAARTASSGRWSRSQSSATPPSGSASISRYTASAVVSTPSSSSTSTTPDRHDIASCRGSRWNSGPPRRAPILPPALPPPQDVFRSPEPNRPVCSAEGPGRPAPPPDRRPGVAASCLAGCCPAKPLPARTVWREDAVRGQPPDRAHRHHNPAPRPGATSRRKHRHRSTDTTP